MLRIQNALNNLPNNPGVYIYYNKDKKVIYIGKSKNLKARVSSYFQKSITLTPKTRKLVESIKYIDIIKTQTEVEAFLLEASLIKQYKPKFNIQLKDDKDYVYILVDKVLVKDKSYFKVFVGRIQKQKYFKSFGPYVDAKTTKKVLRVLRKIFPFASCSKSKFLTQKKQNRPCLYGQIGLCPAPCVNDTNFKENNKNVQKLIKFLTKGYAKYTEQVTKQMNKYSKELNFEKALKLRNHLYNIKRLETTTVLPTQYQDNPNLLEEIYNTRIKDINKIFHLNKKNLRIECYDISNIMGQWATGSMVVSENGRLAKQEYRKFRIKYTKGITDFGMMYEVIRRRIKKDWARPDILLIDGGKGQVSSVLKAIENTGFENVFVVGIFKPNDLFVVNANNYKKATQSDLFGGGVTRWKVIRPNRMLLGYQHLRELRDEAHRFAKTYHKKLRTVTK